MVAVVVVDGWVGVVVGGERLFAGNLMRIVRRGSIACNSNSMASSKQDLVYHGLLDGNR